MSADFIKSHEARQIPNGVEGFLLPSIEGMGESHIGVPLVGKILPMGCLIPNEVELPPSLLVHLDKIGHNFYDIGKDINF
ncbi:hypothetical protein [Desulfocurvibacter africanus]|uniref:hypothetical protein n=1 Tax=Desulfocurvibacter africanus TaxID=873 RepID=UPI0003FECC19|nr:hypothetical protein [Desulfocurvibacter africanus]